MYSYSNLFNVSRVFLIIVTIESLWDDKTTFTNLICRMRLPSQFHMVVEFCVGVLLTFPIVLFVIREIFVRDYVIFVVLGFL